MRALRLAVVTVGCLSLCRQARADFKEWTVTLAPSYAVAYADSRTAHGGGFALDVGYGVTDALSVKARGDLSWHVADATDQQAAGVLAGYTGLVGVNYTLDVIRLVPSFDVLLGVLGVRSTAGFGADERVGKPITALGLGLGFNLEYLLTRHWAVGVEVHYQVALTDSSRLPMYLYAGPRASFRWGGPKWPRQK